ncbi:hypothetical protein GY45DRAFT_1375213 [Cubamyces sp. BRFM 1775]|nr:hypothetical protein GY45DRAFT_1375213 [Cubamyces sp. BRFM 1775]
MQFSTLVKLAFVVTNVGISFVAATALEGRIVPDAPGNCLTCSVDADCPSDTCVTLPLGLSGLLGIPGCKPVRCLGVGIQVEKWHSEAGNLFDSVYDGISTAHGSIRPSPPSVHPRSLVIGAFGHPVLRFCSIPEVTS